MYLSTNFPASTKACLLVLTALLTACPSAARSKRSPAPPDVEPRSCDLTATKGYCIAMTAMSPGLEALVKSCTADGGTLLGTCRSDDTIAVCSLPVKAPYDWHQHLFSGVAPHAWTVEAARTECASLGGEFQLPYR